MMYALGSPDFGVQLLEYITTVVFVNLVFKRLPLIHVVPPDSVHLRSKSRAPLHR